MLALLRYGLLLMGLSGSAGAPAARLEHQEAAPAEEGRSSARPLDRLRQRLRARPGEERARLERHLEEFERLPPEARRVLLGRARALRERERALDAARASEPRGPEPGTEELPVEPSGEPWRARLRESFRERGREVRARLPESLRERLEQAPPEQRRRFLERLAEERDGVSRTALAKMRDRLGLSTREIQRLERLPLSERLHAMRELGSAGRARHRR